MKNISKYFNLPFWLAKTWCARAVHTTAPYGVPGIKFFRFPAEKQHRGLEEYSRHMGAGFSKTIINKNA